MAEGEGGREVNQREELVRLRKMRTAVLGESQTGVTKYRAAILDRQIRILEREEQNAIDRLAITFLGFYKNTGTFVAVSANGARLEAAPIVTRNSVETMSNVISEADYLAKWQILSEPRLPNVSVKDAQQ